MHTDQLQPFTFDKTVTVAIYKKKFVWLGGHGPPWLRQCRRRTRLWWCGAASPRPPRVLIGMLLHLFSKFAFFFKKKMQDTIEAHAMLLPSLVLKVIKKSLCRAAMKAL